jgi:hypothetical protein
MLFFKTIYQDYRCSQNKIQKSALLHDVYFFFCYCLDEVTNAIEIYTHNYEVSNLNSCQYI